MNATNFIYDGIALNSFSMIPVSFNGADNSTISIGSEVDYADERPFDSYFWNYYGGQYNDPLKINVSIGMDECSESYTTSFINLNLERQINKWLSPKQGFKSLVIPYNNGGDNETDENIYFYAHVTSLEKQLFNGRCVGFNIEFTTNAPWGFSEVKTINKTISNSSFSIVIDSDSQEKIYPHITITSNYVGTITLTNTTHNISSSFDNVTSGEVITMDKNNSGLTSTSLSRNIIEDFNKNWFYLKDGVNAISCPSWSGTLVITYQEPRKVGI